MFSKEWAPPGQNAWDLKQHDINCLPSLAPFSLPSKNKVKYKKIKNGEKIGPRKKERNFEGSFDFLPKMLSEFERGFI